MPVHSSSFAVTIVRTASSKPRLSTLILLSALAILPVNFFLPSLPRMATEFDVAYGIMGLSLAAYAGVSACLQLVLGPLSDRFGRRPVILLALAIFIVATIGCALAPDAWTFLACRMVQAIIAPTYAVSLAAIRDTTSREQVSLAISPWPGPLRLCSDRRLVDCWIRCSVGEPASTSWHSLGLRFWSCAGPI